MSEKTEHLAFIQQIISRMSANSFLIKSWSVTLVSALLVLLIEKEVNKNYVFFALIPIIQFWFLDAYYLHQERLFRALYDKVRLLSPEEIDFSMQVGPAATKNLARWPLFEPLLLLFHGALAVATLIARFLL